MLASPGPLSCGIDGDVTDSEGVTVSEIVRSAIDRRVPPRPPAKSPSIEELLADTDDIVDESR